MLIQSLIILLLSNSITLRRDKSILYSRTTITILLISCFIAYDNLHFFFLSKGIGIYAGLFHSTSTTTVFHIFILLVSSIILTLTAFYPRKVWLDEFSSMGRLLFAKLIYYQTIILNKMGEQYKIIEYSLIVLFIVIGAMFLISTSDLVSIFLSIELQSYGLYLLSSIYRDSESATSGGLMYFLLGGLSSCFILLSTSLLYANSGTTNLDSLYIITSISNVSKDNMTNLFYWYKSYYINISLLFMSVGFLFKVSAAPFHFWSPDVYDAIPTIVTTFVAIISKISIFIFLLELVHYTSNSIFDTDFSWTVSLLLSSILSLTVGTIVGLTQSRIKRLYAFSTISHVGFILLGLSIHTIESTQAFMFYLMQYSVSNLNAFILIITVGYSLYSYVYKHYEDEFIIEPGDPFWAFYTYDMDSDIHYSDIIHPDSDSDIHNSEIIHTLFKDSMDIHEDYRIISDAFEAMPPSFKDGFDMYKDYRDYLDALPMTTESHDVKDEERKRIKESHNSLQDINNSPIQLIDQLKGYYYINPVIAFSLAITLFSFAGIPPLIGFFAKQMILTAAIDSGYIFISFIAILTSVISAVYYLAIIKQIFFHKPDFKKNPMLDNIYADALITEKNNIIKEVYIFSHNIVISSSLSLPISIITFIISLFIFIPQEWLSLANILALILFNI